LQGLPHCKDLVTGKTTADVFTSFTPDPQHTVTDHWFGQKKIARARFGIHGHTATGGGRSNEGFDTLSVMHNTTVKVLSRFHSMLYRVSRGRIGTRLVGNDMLLLTTVGSSSGEPHTVPLLYLSDGTDYIVIASYGGRPNHPQWYRNLLADSHATILVGSSMHHVAADTMSTADRNVWWPQIVAAYSDYAVYQSRTERTIPVVRLMVRESDPT
jgi:F420H(2)-dependent quinone reductase